LSVEPSSHVLTFIHSLSVGDAAKNAFHSNPENTVFDAKRLIGRKMDDPEVKRDQKHWYVPPFLDHTVIQSLIYDIQAIQDC
jgi:molecular chaperone DnaK (HSP70)